MSGPEDSKSIRILNVEPVGYSPEAHSLLMQWGSVVEKAMSRSELLRALGGYDVLIVRLAHQVDREVISAGRCLKAIVTATTGLDHIDVEYAQSQGVAILSLRDETEFLRSINATAEHTWALLLGLLRRIVPAAIAARNGGWNRDAFRGHELNGKRLGIVGLGRVGEKVARFGQAFGMEVGAHDPTALEWLDWVWRASSLPELLGWSEVLSLHVPLNTDTEGMIGESALALLPAGAVLINTSRGEILDEVALVQALESGRLVGAALDVVAHERDMHWRRKSPLLAYASAHDNLVITPHIGGATFESMARSEILMAEKLGKFLASRGFLTHPHAHA